jgi:hypothetical protein
MGGLSGLDQETTPFADGRRADREGSIPRTNRGPE